MGEVCRRHGAKLVVVPLDLWPGDSLAYRRYLSHAGVASIDCARRDLLSRPELLVPGEGHPNAVTNSYWASCIARSLAADPALRP